MCEVEENLIRFSQIVDLEKSAVADTGVRSQDLQKIPWEMGCWVGWEKVGTSRDPDGVLGRPNPQMALPDWDGGSNREAVL